MADKEVGIKPNVPILQDTPKATYSIMELVMASRKLFPRHTGALVEVALKETKRNSFSVEEAKAIVDNFAKREVKR